MRKTIAIAIAFILFGFQLSAQETFTRKDSLQGGLRFERTCYDVQHYDLNVHVNIDDKSISGNNYIDIKIVETTNKIQLDLFENMVIDSIVLWNKKINKIYNQYEVPFKGTKLNYKRDNNAVFIDFPAGLTKASDEKIMFYYHGKPLVAKNAPWDGGFVFTKDDNGKPWVAVAVQGTGASLWYPCKDSQTDEPDNGATIGIYVPEGLMGVSNGRLLSDQYLSDKDGKGAQHLWFWEVKNPINNYDITLNIGDYVNIHDTHNGLDLDYYVLSYNKEKAKKQFEEVKPMLDCFESKFGKYPFAEDSYKLVETPYLGMEHQSAVAYGNKYKMGYAGTDISGTGIGLLFDYIIVHESGHEWFGNSITSKDIADMWIHEGFTMYTEAVYVECQYGYDKAMEYINGMKRNFNNDKPIIGPYGVNKEGSSDMYYKGALMLNTIRHIIGNDEKWWKMLLKYSETYRHQIIDTETVITFFNTESGMDLSPVFDQYLRTIKIPVLSINTSKNGINYKWQHVGANFNMPVDIEIKGKKIRLFPTLNSQRLKITKSLKSSDLKVLKDHFLIEVIN